MVTDLTCGMCGRVFAEDQAQPTCVGCPLKGGCQLARCPYCGYENAIEPQWLLRVRGWFSSNAARAAGYDATGAWQGDV